MTVAQLLKTSRPRFWIYLIGPILIAFAASGLQFSPLLLLLGLYATLPANLLIYGVNDIFDRDTDALNTKKSGYERRLDAGSLWYLVFWIIVLNVPFLVAFALLMPPPVLGWIALFVITGVGYSAPPIRAKTKPFLDASFNVLYVCLGFGAFSLLTGQTIPWQLIVAAGCWCAAMHAYSAVPDIAADRGARLSTIATVLGAKGTLVVCTLLYITSGLLSAPWLGAYSLLATAVYVIMMLVSFAMLSRNNVFAVYRYFPLTNSLVGMGLWFWIVLG